MVGGVVRHREICIFVIQAEENSYLVSLKSF